MGNHQTDHQTIIKTLTIRATFNCSKSTMETPDQCAKSVELTIKTTEWRQ